jgi:hypothetical protein
MSKRLKAHPLRMPLVESAKFKDDKRRRRVEVLLNTIQRFELCSDLYECIVERNMETYREIGAGFAAMIAPLNHQWFLCAEGDLLETAQKLTKCTGECFACLNMANEDCPGGGYTKGVSAQEENLFRRTNAHFTLDETVMQYYNTERGKRIYYKRSMTELISGTTGLVYMPPKPLICIRGREVFEQADLGYRLLKPEEIFQFYELRSAAIDRDEEEWCHLSADDPKLVKAMEARIESQFQTLITRKIRHVVLSAFGCGAFRNDPRVVAMLYRKAVEKYGHHFTVIAWAIYYAGNGESNFATFQSVLAPVLSPSSVTETLLSNA